MTLKKPGEEAVRGRIGVAPPSPGIPSKRARVIPAQVGLSPYQTAPVFMRKMKNAAVGTGCDIRLKVAVAGDPQPALHWYRNETLLSMDNQEYGGLWIRDCKLSDAGLYTCIATNPLGEARTSAVLAVMDLEVLQRAPHLGDIGLCLCHFIPEDVIHREQMRKGATGFSWRLLWNKGDHAGMMNLRLYLNAQSHCLWTLSEDVLREDYGCQAAELEQRRDLGSLRYPSSRPQVLPPPSPKIGQRPTSTPQPTRSGSAPATPLTPRKKVVIPFDYQDTVPGEFEEKIKQPKSSALSQTSTQDSRPQTPLSEYSRKDLTLRPSPKLARASSKIFEKVRYFEERRRSIDQPEGSISGRSWAGFNRARSFEQSDDEKSRTGISRESSREDLREALRADAVQRRSMFKQKASSFEDRPRYTHKIQDIENKFTEELQRIKKVVGKPNLGKSFSTEQLAHRKPMPLSEVPDRLSPRERKVIGSSREINDGSLPVETQQKAEDQPSPTSFPLEVLPTTRYQPQIQKVEPKPASPLVKKEMSRSHEAPAPVSSEVARYARIPSPLSSPFPEEEEEEMEVEETPVRLAPKPAIPQIIVPEEPEEIEAVLEADRKKKTTFRKEAKMQRSRGKGQRPRPMSPELESSDDSYVSAGEDPLEPPVFEVPLQDMVVLSGSEVLLKCIIAGNPLPEATWRRDNFVIKSSATHLVKVEGERHTLLIKWAKPSDTGVYCVTAVNEIGKASNSAKLTVKSATLSVPLDISSPITSDEEYLSPLEEGLEFGVPFFRGPETMRISEVTEPKSIIGTHFKEPPSFEVYLSDQTVIEGQDVTMSVRIHGEPKPLIYWLRNRVTIKTGSRHCVSETENSTFDMKIMAAEKSDAGVYTCKAINEYGTKQCECKLEVKAPPAEPALVITRHARDVTVKAGEMAVFECQITGPPDVDVDWLSNGKLVQPALLNCKMHFDGKRCKLLLNSVHEDDSATYTCKLSTAKEELTSSANLKVIPSIEPLFTRKIDILEVMEGRTARFDCKVSGTPPPKVTWSHFDQALKESENIRILKDQGLHSLIISHVSNENEGFYTVIANNVHGETECSAELYVQEPRPAVSSQIAKLEKMPSIPEEPEVPDSEVERFTMPDFVKPLYDLDVVEGKEAVLKCKVAGLPYPTITWFHNGPLLPDTNVLHLQCFLLHADRDIHSLVIRSVTHSHGGVYKSVISNKVGKATCYAHLYVTDVLPDPPDGAPVVEAITGKTISLRWKKPKKLDPSIDASSLTYAIQQQAVGSNQWIIMASNLKKTSYTVHSLSKGVLYAFRILSATSKAYSKPSPPTEPLQLVDRGPYLEEAPVIIDKPDVVYVVENQTACITITLNHVHAGVTWKRNDSVLVNKPGQFEMSMPDDDQHTLQILRVRGTDVGELTCIASNQYGSDSCSLSLEMAVAPSFESIMEDMDVNVGETPRFAVVVDGKPIPDIMWYKNDVLLSESSHFTFVYDDNECSLVILSSREEDSAVYTCTAKNLAGSVSCKAELTVHTAKLQKEEQMEDEETLLRKMRRLTDYYDVHKEIGRGAFSYVKRVTEKGAKVDYAAKFISTRAKRKASALREMNILSQLDHERVLYFHDAFEKTNTVIIITELCQEELMERVTKKSSVLESEIRSYMRQLLEGIGYLHQNNILHLDVKPANILMADSSSEQIRICDFGNAVEFTPDEAQYCKYGTPEFVAPEIVNQTPVSKATDIWSVGVVTYLCITGVSPFVGENDRATVMNIRNYNVAFEESMFADLCREAKGFVIKLLVADRLRPDANECLRHPWFKILAKGKSITTEPLKLFLSRRKWQRSLIHYKSKMVMRSIPELLDDSSSHISIAVPRHLKEGSPPPSSSSDSDDIDELPFIPMPLTMEFSGSRMSLNEIPNDDEMVGRPNGIGRSRKRATQEEDLASSDEEGPEVAKRPEQPKRALRKGSSVESDKAEGGSKRGELRRGSSADSALLLHIKPEEGAPEELTGESKKCLKKAVSMELPRRSPSPGTLDERRKLSQEDYALKLELMRQRLLRGGSVDSKMSGLRGPLLETLGIGGDASQKRSSSLERYARPPRAGPIPPLARAASSDTPREEHSETKVLRKSASFSQGDSEPIPLHRRSGAPLEITKLDSRPVTPREISSKPPTPDLEKQEAALSGVCEKLSTIKKEERSLESKVESLESKADLAESVSKMEEGKADEDKPVSVSAEGNIVEKVPKMVVEEKSKKTEREKDSTVKPDKQAEAKVEKVKLAKKPPQIIITSATIVTVPVAVPAKATQNGISSRVSPSPTTRVSFALPSPRPSAPGKEPSPVKEPSPPKSLPKPSPPREPSPEHLIEDIASEEVFEAKFKKRESSLTRGLKLLTRSKSEEKSLVQPPASGEEVYRPGPIGAPLEFVKPVEPKKMEERARSVQDLREAEKDTSFMRRLSLRLKRTPSTERKEVKVAPSEQEVKETKKPSESPVIAMRKKIESTVAGISMRIRSHSEERKEEKKPEAKEVKQERRTPLLSLLRRSSSEGTNLRRMGIPQNQLASQAPSAPSTVSLESNASIQSEAAIKSSETEHRSRWDRWGLSRGRRDKVASQPDIPSAITRENGSLHPRQYSRLASDFPPVFHIKLRDHVLLEGDSITLCCLPAGSPSPHIVWKKDKKPLDVDARMNIVSCPDGRQLLMILGANKKDAGLYECVATNPLASVTSSCTLSLARLPNRPGTPEIPQRYKNTVLVLWKPSDTHAPCTYTLERKTEGDSDWLIVATGVPDCYYNVTDLPTGGTFKFRVACVNKAGQGPYSNSSEKVCLDGAAPAPTPVKAVLFTPPAVVTKSVTLPPNLPTPVEISRATPSPLPLKPPSPVLTKAPSPLPLKPPSPVLMKAPSPLPLKPPSPVLMKAPSPLPIKPPSPLTPAPLPVKPPSPVLAKHTEAQITPSITPTPTTAKTTLTITVTTSSSAFRPPPPAPEPRKPTLIIPKPPTPINLLPPVSPAPPITPPPLVSPPPTIGKPISPLPMYVPATPTRIPPSTASSLTPPVVLVTSLSPVGEGAPTPTRLTPSGRMTPSAKLAEGTTALRQGVPQKPYTFMDEKARGRYGVVRECRENATGKLFMAKIVPYEQESKQAVLQEYEILKSLHHDKIMALHEAYVTPRYLVLISESCAGKELLYSLIDRFRYSEDDVVGYIVQMLQGLEYLHNRRILHLDMKPDNVIITYMNVVKIIDFGSAQTFNPLFLKQLSRRLGTLEYMSPEMVKGDVVGPPADIWGLGVVTYVMLSGRLPFLEADPLETETKILAAKFDLSKLYPNVSQSASLFLKKILCSYPWARPTIKDCFSNSWLQDAYLMKLRRQTLTFTTTRLKEFLVEHQRKRSEVATKHKVLLRSYQSGPQPAAPVTQ
ncbi:SPEG kinase, partial [Amia calva]|nr:SPEG kinase [Amia calva]